MNGPSIYDGPVRALTLQDLAFAARSSEEEIRGWIARGLLAPAELLTSGETFRADHLERAELIGQLRAQGFGVDLIDRLLGDPQQLDQLRRVLGAFTEGNVTTTVEALVARFGDFDGRVLDRAIKSRLLIGRPDGRIDVPSPTLLDVAERAVAEGISLMSAVEVAGAVREACLNASGTFLHVLVDEIWQPWAEAGFPDEQRAEVARRMHALRPIVYSVFEATLPSVIVRVFDETFEDDLGIASRPTDA